MSLDSKSFIKLDVTILVATLVYFGVAQTSIDTDYSSGYSSIYSFFLGQTIIQCAFQIGLILADLRNNKTCVVSLRSGAFFFMIGMSLILVFLGLLSLWLILFIAVAGYLHLTLFYQGLKMTNDSAKLPEDLGGLRASLLGRGNNRDEESHSHANDNRSKLQHAARTAAMARQFNNRP